MGGVCREFTRPEKIVYTELMDGFTSETLVTLVLAEQDSKTLLTVTSLCESREVRDAILKSGMESGVNESYAALDKLLETLR